MLEKILVRSFPFDIALMRLNNVFERRKWIGRDAEMIFEINCYSYKNIMHYAFLLLSSLAIMNVSANQSKWDGGKLKKWKLRFVYSMHIAWQGRWNDSLRVVIIVVNNATSPW